MSLITLARETFIESFAPHNPAHDTDLYVAQAFAPEAMRAEFETENSTFYFAENADGIIGYLKTNTGIAQSDTPLDNAFEIERIYVPSAFQGLAIGKALYDFALDLAIKGLYQWLWLGVWEENEKAIVFYERQGLKAFASHSFKFGTQVQSDTLMRIALSG